MAIVNSHHHLSVVVVVVMGCMQAALGLVSMMLHYTIVKTVERNRPCKNAQVRLLWRDKTCPART